MPKKKNPTSSTSKSAPQYIGGYPGDPFKTIPYHQRSESSGEWLGLKMMTHYMGDDCNPPHRQEYDFEGKRQNDGSVAICCPNCDGTLHEEHCKLKCNKCGYFVSCSE